MNKFESKYQNTARLMDEALILLLDDKDLEYITVKEICRKAGVNRSTFYLHYESTADLLEESIAYVSEKFFEHMKPLDSGISTGIEDLPLDKLYFITPEFLTPYLTFIKGNKRLFAVLNKKGRLFRVESSYNSLFSNVFEPILARFGLPESERRYTMAYYINGLVAIVNEWLKGGCSDPIEDVVAVMRKCVRRLPEKYAGGEKTDNSDK